MQFREDGVDDFLQMFGEKKELIRNFPGCMHVELRREEESGKFVTLSVWEKPEDLENYRHSDLFQETWKLTKSWFSGPAEAFSLFAAEYAG